MAAHRSIKTRKQRRRINQVFDLQLTSMMDVLVIIVVFLLKSYSTSTNSFTLAPGLELPISRSQDIPTDSIQIIVTPEAITLDNERISDFVLTSGSVGSKDAIYQFKKLDLDEGGRRVVPLYDALTKAKNRADLLRARSGVRDKDGNLPPFEGVLAVQADKRISYDTLRRIMYTSAAAGYKIFRFLALKKE